MKDVVQIITALNMKVKKQEKEIEYLLKLVDFLKGKLDDSKKT